MFYNHPYQYVYFNEFARGSAEENFSIDYWRVSTGELAGKILFLDDRERITVDMHYNTPLILHPEEQERLVRTNPILAPDYKIWNSRDPEPGGMIYKGYDKIHRIVVDGFEVSSLHRYQIDSNSFDSTVIERISSITASENNDSVNNIVDGANNTVWVTAEPRTEGDWIELTFEQPVSYNLIRLTAVPVAGYSHDLQITVSPDGITWETPTVIYSNLIDHVIESTIFKHIRIENLENHEANRWLISEISFGNISLND